MKYAFNSYLYLDMISIIQENIASIRQLCELNKVKSLWVFGSAASGAVNSESDIDFLYEWEDEAISDDEYLENMWSLLDKLENLLDRKIDCVHYPSLNNPFILAEI